MLPSYVVVGGGVAATVVAVGCVLNSPKSGAKHSKVNKNKIPPS